MTTNNKTISAADVLARAQKLQHGSNQFDTWCAKYVEEAVLGRSNVYKSAKQWQDTARKRGALNTTKQAPAGVPVFFDTSNVNEHVAISAGNGYVYSTGIGGKIKKVPESYFGKSAGWTSAIGGQSGVPLQYINYKKTNKPASISKGSSSAFASGAVGKPTTKAAKAFVDNSLGTSATYIPGVK